MAPEFDWMPTVDVPKRGDLIRVTFDDESMNDRSLIVRDVELHADGTVTIRFIADPNDA
jgi:hypothetical protein